MGRGAGRSFGLPGAPGHVVQVGHGVDDEQEVGTGDADDVEEPVEHQVELLRVHDGRDDVDAGHGYDEDAAGRQDGLVLHHRT